MRPGCRPDPIRLIARAVAQDGRVVIAASSDGSVSVLERPRGGSLGAPQRLTDPLQSINADEMAVAFGADGRAVVAWHDTNSGATGAAIRDSAAGFGPSVVIVPPPKTPRLPSFGADLPVVHALPPLQAAFAPDGRVHVVWSDDGVRVATVAGNAVVERQLLGSRLRDPEGLSLLALRDGGRALAWTNQDRFDAHAPIRVHYAVEGAPEAPEPAAPRISVGRPRERALRPAQSLALPVRCSAACDLSVTLASEGAQAVERSLTHAGTVIVRLPPPERGIAPARPGRVRITVRSSAPGARTVARTVTTPRLRRLPALPLPKIEAVRARRLSGGRVEVRWRVSSDARETLLLVTGTRTRKQSQDDDPALEALAGQRRRRYRVVLEDATDTRWIHVEVLQFFGEHKRSVTVRLP